MSDETGKGWRVNRQINLSVLIQLVCLATLIVGSWINLQRQLDFLQRDVTMLIESNERFQNKLEDISGKTIAFEYRIRSMENYFKENGVEKRNHYSN